MFNDDDDGRADDDDIEVFTIAYEGPGLQNSKMLCGRAQNE